MKKILAIDDQKDNLVTLKAVIKGQLPDCKLITALSGKEGIKIASKEQPDVILLDIIMPKMDGYEVCEKLKADQLTKHIPIILVTAIKTDAESRIKGLNLGADAFISKPIEAIELKAQINVMLRIKAAEDQLRAEKEKLIETANMKTAELIENEEQFRLIAENTIDNIAITSFDLKAKYLYVSPSIKSVLGYEKEDLLGKSFFNFVHPDDKKALFPVLVKYVNLKIKNLLSKSDLPLSQTIEFRFRNKAGNWQSMQSIVNVVDKKLLAVTRDITEQKKAEEAIKESEEKYKALYKNAPLPFQSLNEDGNIIDVNDAWLIMLGYEKDKVIGKWYGDFLESDSQLTFKKNFPALKKCGAVQDVPFKIVGHNGQTFEIALNGLSSYHPDGNFKQTYCVFKDITEQKKAELALKESEKRYRSLMENLPVGVFRSTYEGEVISANPAMAEIYGYNSVEELLELPAVKYYHSNNPRQKMLDELVKNKYLLGWETLEHKKDGTLIWVSANYQAGFSENGEIKHIDGVIIDITERKQVEAALKESEERFKELVELLPEAVFETDENLKLTYVNKRALEISGYSEADFKKGIDGLSILSPDSQKKAKLYLNERLTGKTHGTVEYDAQKKDGTKCPILFNANSIIKDNRFSGLRGVIVDITDKKLAEDKLLESKNQYQALFDQIADPILVFDQQTKKFLNCNSAMLKKYGYTLEELFEMTPMDLHPEDGDLDAILKNIENEETSSPNEYLHQAKDGTIYNVETHTQELTYNNRKAWITIIRDITQRKEIENELKKSEQDYRGLFENAHDAIIIFTQDDEIVLDVNQHACDIYGFDRNEFIGMSMISISHNPAEGKKYVKSTIKNGFYNGFETTQYKKDGSPIFMEVNASVVEFGGQLAILSNNRDVTSKKLAEKASLENAEKYRALYTSTNDAIFLMQDYTFLSCNSRALEIFGCEEDDFIGHAASKFSPELQPNGEASANLAAKKIDAALAGKSQTFEWVHKKHNGTLFNAEVTLTKMNLSDDEYVHAIVRDITSRKRSEQIQKALYNISNAVIESENLEEFISLIKEELGGIIDTTNFFIAFYNKEKDTFFSPFLSDEIDDYDTWPAGKTFSSYVVKSSKSLLIKEKDVMRMESEGLIEIVGAIPKSGMIVPLNYEGETTGVFAVQSYTNENAYSQSDLEMMDFVSDQISLSIHRKNAEQNLKNALKKATESDRLKSTFLATMSHELRTPLNAIIGFSDIIDKNLSMDEILQFTKTINDSGNHLLTIVEDLFDITLIESGQIKIEKEEIPLIQILNNVHEIIKAEQDKTGKSNLDLKLLIPPNMEDLIINTDRSKFKQVLINLLKNAIKFTAKGEVSYGFEEEIIDANPFLKFFVKDTGIGIREDQQELIFDIFRQADETYTTAHGGTGIGLSITKKLTELLGGNIWLISERGRGSTFYFTIPNEHSSVLNKKDLTKGMEKRSLKTKTILIAEDVEASYQLIEAMLSKLQVNLIWAKDGEDTIKLCEDNPQIDLVLMDINMPILNGYDATKAIKEMRPDLPIIAQTAYAIIGDREKSIEAGCDDYISKPIKKESLIKIINKYIK